MGLSPERQQGLEILGNVEDKLQRYSPDPSLRASNALTPTYKDIRMERFTAWAATGKPSQLGGRIVDYSENLLSELQRAESALGHQAPPDEALGRLYFAKGRLNALIARWTEARNSYQKALEYGFSEAVVCYYQAITYDLDGSEMTAATTLLRRATQLEGSNSPLSAECRKQLDLLEHTPSPTRSFSAAMRQSPKGTEDKAGGCFIATAVYGASMAPEVIVFRRFRDEVLLASTLGTWCIRIYYVISPPFATVISKSTRLRGIARKLLRSLLLLIIKTESTKPSQGKARR